MIIILNNKSNLSKDEFITYQEELKQIKSDFNLVLCPTYLNINLFNLNNFHLAAQNVSSNQDGAYTGEVSATDLKKSGVEYTLVGHSERRKYLHENNKDIHKKIKIALENNITPILCIGETKAERQSNKVKEVIKKDIIEAIDGLSTEDIKRIIIAYEPIWSIGTGLIPTIKEIDKVNKYIKTILPANKIVYGGSVNEENIDILKQSKLIEGYLLGGLSLHPNRLQIFLDKIKSV